MISVIIPTLNEEARIAQTIQQVRSSAKNKDNTKNKEIEIIIADASSHNKVKQAVKSSNITYLHSPPYRGPQMNHGAKHASGDILLFLHADTKLPQGWDQLIIKSISDGYDGGGFLKQFEPNSLSLRALAAFGNMRSTFFHMLLGDNAIFVKRSTFEKMGGYKEIELMEDVDFSSRLKEHKVKILKEKVITSSRKLIREGVWHMMWVMTKLRMRYLFGARPEDLHKVYYKQK